MAFSNLGNNGGVLFLGGFMVVFLFLWQHVSIFIIFTFLLFILALLPSKPDKAQVNQTNKEANKIEDETKIL